MQGEAILLTRAFRVIVRACFQKCDYSHGLGVSDLEFVKAMACLIHAMEPKRPFERQPCAHLPGVDAAMLARAAKLVADESSTALQRIVTTAAFVALACKGKNVRAQSA